MNKEKLKTILQAGNAVNKATTLGSINERLTLVIKALLEGEEQEQEQKMAWAYHEMPVLVWSDNPKRKYLAYLIEVVEEGCTAVIDPTRTAGVNPLTWANWEPNWEHPDMWHPYDIDSLQPDAKKEGCIYLQSGRVICGNFQRLLHEYDKTRIIAYRYAPKAPDIL